jgi:hypothetical protein
MKPGRSECLCANYQMVHSLRNKPARALPRCVRVVMPSYMTEVSSPLRGRRPHARCKKFKRIEPFASASPKKVSQASSREHRGTVCQMTSMAMGLVVCRKGIWR